MSYDVTYLISDKNKKAINMNTNKSNKDITDMLSKIFNMQIELNDYVFKNNCIKDNQGHQRNSMKTCCGNGGARMKLIYRI
jgi:hypothetical protein